MTVGAQGDLLMTRRSLLFAAAVLPVWPKDGDSPYKSAGFLTIPPQVKLDSVSAVECDSKRFGKVARH